MGRGWTVWETTGTGRVAIGVFTPAPAYADECLLAAMMAPAPQQRVGEAVLTGETTAPRFMGTPEEFDAFMRNLDGYDDQPS